MENVSQVGVFALRVVPNGVEATTAGGGGGALLFIGRAEARFCAEAPPPADCRRPQNTTSSLLEELHKKQKGEP